MIQKFLTVIVMTSYVENNVRLVISCAGLFIIVHCIIFVYFLCVFCEFLICPRDGDGNIGLHSSRKASLNSEFPYAA